MGLASFFALLRGESKPKINNTSSTRRHNPSRSTGWADYDRGRSRGDELATTALPTAPKNTYHTSEAGHGERSERKSRTRTVARSISRHAKKGNRRSWFGGRADPDEDIPAVPRLNDDDGNHARDLRPGTALTTNNAEMGENRSRRHSIARSLHRKKSWFRSKEPQATVEALPPMPVNIAPPAAAATSTLPAVQRRRRNSVKTIERRGSMASTIRPRVRRNSFWASSNPDDSDSDVPPVPALIRDDTPDSSSNNSVDILRAGRGIARGDGDKQPRSRSAVSTASRKSYTPRSAAKGFLKSTNVASDEQRKTFRREFHMDDDAELVCLTTEQQIEWAKLMNNQGKLAQKSATQRPEAPEQKTNLRYSNAQALAALEFGVRKY